MVILPLNPHLEANYVSSYVCFDQHSQNESVPPLGGSSAASFSRQSC